MYGNLWKSATYRGVGSILLQVFLGQKYGYRPIPTYILSSELQMLRDELVSSGTDPVILDTWYRKDSNAVPPVSVLQPISSILINFNNKVNHLKVIQHSSTDHINRILYTRGKAC